MNLTAEQLQAAEKGPVTLRAEGKEYVVISREIYDRLKGLFHDHSPLTPEEEEAAFRHAGELAGWDDPELDVYNKLAPKKA
jgi:hypothetical protein